jgi:hypothetical protein
MTWARRHKAATALVPALILVLVIGLTVRILGGRHPASAPAAAPQLAATTRGARWITGPGGKLLNAVDADLGRLAVSERAGKRGLARSAGSQLAAAAGAALSGPMPPASAKIYRSALTGFERAGRYIAHGEFNRASTLLNAGENDIVKVTSAANHPAKAGRRDAVKEPNGQ